LRSTPPQEVLPSRAERNDGRHGQSGEVAKAARVETSINLQVAQHWSVACWGRWHRGAPYMWRGRADGRSRHAEYRAVWDDLSGALRLVQSACHGAAAVSVSRRGRPRRVAASLWTGGLVS